jgi:acyl-coenzyme A synthetase/AMP-(fatty) acid ligase
VLSDDYGRSLTTVELREAASVTAAAFAARGIGPATVVSWQLPTTLEAMVVMVALARLGAVQNPVLPIWREREVAFVTRQLATEFLVVPGVWRGFDHLELAQSLARHCAMEVIVIDHATDPTADALRLPVSQLAELPAAPQPGADTRWVYYSSGTTAAPKGVRHTDHSVIAGSSGMLDPVGVTDDDVYPIPFPVSHIGGALLLATALQTGLRLVLFDAFDPIQTPLAIAAHRPTLLGTATPFYVAFMAAQHNHGLAPLFPDLRACLGGGAPITAELGRQVRQTLSVPGIANAWGLTEFPVATSPAPNDQPAVLDHTVGRPVPGVRVRIVDEQGHEMPIDQEGELRLKGPQCFAGYVDSSEDAGAFDAGGWFCTGDMGLLAPDGSVVVTGRIKDAIIRNAENISALEVEETLVCHDSVADVAVIGVPDVRTGERICAVVVLVPGTKVSLASLVEHCRAEGLPRHKHPERLEVVDDLPRNLTGKVLKTELRRAYS